MTNNEVLDMLHGIKPESFEQYKKLTKCIEIWEDDDNLDFTDDYASMLKEADILDRPCADVYKDYTDWCVVNHIPEIVHINTFSKYLHYYLQVKSIPRKGTRYYSR